MEIRKATMNTVSFLLKPAPAPPLLPTTAMDRYHKEQNLKKHTLGVPVFTISALAIPAAQYACTFYGYALALIFLFPGIFYGRMNLELVGTLIFGLTLFAQVVVASSDPIPMLITGALVFFVIVYLPTIVERRRRGRAAAA